MRNYDSAFVAVLALSTLGIFLVTTLYITSAILKREAAVLPLERGLWYCSWSQPNGECGQWTRKMT